jgi:hypothetical protein
LRAKNELPRFNASITITIFIAGIHAPLNSHIRPVSSHKRQVSIPAVSKAANIIFFILNII